MGVCNARMLVDDGWKKHNSGLFREKTAGTLDMHGYGCPIYGPLLFGVVATVFEVKA